MGSVGRCKWERGIQIHTQSEADLDEVEPHAHTLLTHRMGKGDGMG